MHLSGWVGAGALTAGVSAALLAGAASAGADTDGGSDPGPAKTSSAGAEKASGTTSSVRTRAKPRVKHSGRPATTATTAATASRLRSSVEDAVEKAAGRPVAKAKAEKAKGVPASRHRLPALRSEARTQTDERPTPQTKKVEERRASTVDAPAVDSPAVDSSTVDARDPLAAISQLASRVSETVGSVVFNTIGAVIRAADGPPVVPLGLRDSVEVSSSTLVVSPGNEVASDWYFPTDGEPDRLIYLQHGFIATGPMYSYTASYLADRTNSVVVVTTVTSNPYAEGGMWLGGDNMHKAVAELFLDSDRDALNASMTTASLKAGREPYLVPQQFVLVGHSLGGGFAPGVAGYYAEGLVARRADGQDAPNDLAGVVLLDGVPPSGTLPNAMERLAQLEASNGNDPADYVPVYEIGAPSNAFNSTSTVNEDLSAARPGKFNGVVVDGGVHMDSMLGGNPLIQAAAYLVAGIPQPQNPPAVQWLMAGWVNDMFDGNIDPTTGRCLSDCHGIYAEPGDALDIDGDRGDATAEVIDSGPPPNETLWNAIRFIPSPATSIPGSVLSRWV
ncbi:MULTISPECIES: hypothetical protein [Mycobacterium]|uniref:Alpha/beta hydrolase n=1 Tax=Mycobacterium syngnathidarum TaxID=1908205 RepID=A0A1S1K787_9MYCO|nr:MULTISPECIES: hypothetical protein [Mycobacterium]MCG7607801.1 hypothetical protein [Mycobacterium sp. CnD-18-1]OHU00747.1 hypothetical protein BKG61_11995 [Mycobacterium syngnathidarum]